jgi:hypothetical protein
MRPRVADAGFLATAGFGFCLALPFVIASCEPEENDAERALVFGVPSKVVFVLIVDAVPGHFQCVTDQSSIFLGFCSCMMKEMSRKRKVIDSVLQRPQNVKLSSPGFRPPCIGRDYVEHRDPDQKANPPARRMVATALWTQHLYHKPFDRLGP